LQELGLIKVSDYFRPGLKEVDSSIRQIDILPDGMAEIQKYRISQQTVTTTTTQTRLEPVDAEEPAWKTNQRLRDRVRTERGNMIVTMCPEALESDIRAHLAALKNPDTPPKTQTLHKIWLSYELNWRWSDIRAELRHEMEDYRDLPSKRKSSAGNI